MLDALRKFVLEVLRLLSVPGWAALYNSLGDELKHMLHDILEA